MRKFGSARNSQPQICTDDKKNNNNLRPTRIKRQFTKPHTRRNLSFGFDRVQDEVK